MLFSPQLIVASRRIVSSGPASTWNSADKSGNIVLSGSDLIAASNSGSNGGVRSTIGRSSGKLYAEFTVGASLAGSNSGVGIVTSGQALTNIAPSNGTNGFLISPFGGGSLYFNGSGAGFSIGGFAASDVIRMAIDFTGSKAWAARNNGSWNGTIADPATGTNGVNIAAVFPGSAAYCFLCSNNSGDGVTANFGASAFTYTPPSGYSAWV